MQGNSVTRAAPSSAAPATSKSRSVVTYITAANPARWRVLGMSHSRPLHASDIEQMADQLAEHLGLPAVDVAVIDVQPIDPGRLA